MGLADLKKNVTPCNTMFEPQMSVDDFIEAANLYAMGKQHSSSNSIENANKQAMEKLLALTEANEPLAKKPAPFKRATFTLSEDAINQLTLLSQSSHTAKSKLIRQLIQQHFSLPVAEQREIEQQIQIR
ncbi:MULTISPECIES: hypothetical protein [Shewanella]|uniref:CopG family transcriptional regulator n=1 Tax=Shewanella japonica TaxID=93973 RepID=A0ABN4YJ47_9GAMM|nr:MULTISPECIES: hypothetical protein [Shewanella]ARD23319.1 hypothetical protein SJ2017_3042 [Shewanella japonica]KPZ68870.1 hypothetical protein AN944_03281 [Shewanella sp. P1-14-1]MBQ4889997.1 hypothetical protein [Shewanella sp. MMG014]OBT10435.1 hypothetical protein A9267_06055 [Shewanella sp. UCD-FRSSP16_17]